MRKTVLVVVAFICFIALSVAFTQAPPGYKNLKILPQDISEQALDSIMHYYSKSLGVKCSLCHVRNEELKTWDMASDAKPEKLITRKMMLMTNDINAKYFSIEDADKEQPAIQTITCYTCHKGEPMPVTQPVQDADNK